jgi:N-acetylneuraminate synthase
LRSTIIKVENKKIGKGYPTFIIGEIAQAHDGSLGTAHAYIDAMAKTGADAVKFQTHIAEAESSAKDQWRTRFSYEDKTRYDYWKRMEFTKEQWKQLKEHAEEKGLVFLSSPFSMDAAELLNSINISAWKIASGEVNNTVIFDYIISTKKPVFLSSGMSDIGEIDRAVKYLKKKDTGLALMQCTSSYPCPPEKIGINIIPFFQDRYNCPVGLSDHSGKIFPALSAVTIGASIIEVHVVFSRECFGPDVSSSLTTSELARVVEGARYVEEMMANPVDKDLLFKEYSGMRKLFNKSLFYNISLAKGEILKKEHLKLLKPGIGVSPERIGEVIGRKLTKDVKQGDLLGMKDLKDVK